MVELHPTTVEALAPFMPIPEENRDMAVAAYRKTISVPYYVTPRVCPQCHAAIYAGVTLKPELLALFPAARATTVWCDRDCLHDWLIDCAADLLKHAQDTAVRDGDWEVRA